MSSDLFGEDLQKILPIIREGGSDTATFDNVLEFLVMAGRSLPHAILMMIPEPWSGHESMRPSGARSTSSIRRSWSRGTDPPRSPSPTARVIGAVLDRNGLRPSRYTVTKDDLVIMASETGVLGYRARERARQGTAPSGPDLPRRHRAGPDRRRRGGEGRAGEGAAVRRRGWPRTSSRSRICRTRRSCRWPIRTRFDAGSSCSGTPRRISKILVAPMARQGEEPVGSMGNDAALAVLSDRPRLLYDYFAQLFAQVTNPPLDAIREKLVTSMESTIGPEGNLLKPTPRVLPADRRSAYPIIDNDQLAKLRHIRLRGLPVRRRCRCCSTRPRTARASSGRWRRCRRRPRRPFARA